MFAQNGPVRGNVAFETHMKDVPGHQEILCLDGSPSDTQPRRVAAPLPRT